MKDAKRKGVSKAASMAYIAAQEAGINLGESITQNNIQSGDKVTLNIEAIKSRKNYDSMTENYKTFVEENAGRVFTAKVEKNSLVTFEEDNTWLFWGGDLQIVEQPNNN